MLLETAEEAVLDWWLCELLGDTEVNIQNHAGETEREGCAKPPSNTQWEMRFLSSLQCALLPAEFMVWSQVTSVRFKHLLITILSREQTPQKSSKHCSWGNGNHIFRRLLYLDQSVRQNEKMNKGNRYSGLNYVFPSHMCAKKRRFMKLFLLLLLRHNKHARWPVPLNRDFSASVAMCHLSPSLSPPQYKCCVDLVYCCEWFKRCA